MSGSASLKHAPPHADLPAGDPAAELLTARLGSQPRSGTPRATGDAAVPARLVAETLTSYLPVAIMSGIVDPAFSVPRWLSVAVRLRPARALFVWWFWWD